LNSFLQKSRKLCSLALKILVLVSCCAFNSHLFAEAGDIVSNRATASFDLGGVSVIVESSPTGNTVAGAGNGASTVFTIDNIINFSLTTNDLTEVEVLAAETGAVLTFTLTNVGNAVQDFVFTPINTNANPFAPPADSIDATNLAVFVESGANPGYQPAEDTQTFVDGLTFDPVGAGNQQTLYLVGEIPATAIVGDVISLALVAQVAQSPATGADAVQGAIINIDDAANPDNANAIDIVFADPAGISPEDVDVTGAAQDIFGNGQAADASAFIVTPPAVSIVKSIAIINSVDNTAHGPYFSGGSSQPGATLRYTLTVDITGSSNVNSLLLTDAIPVNTTYVPESITVNSVAQTDANNTGVDFSNFNVTLANGIAGDRRLNYDVI